MLHGLPVYHTEDMPTCALLNPSSVMPVAYNIACEAPWDLGCVILAETLLSCAPESLARYEDVDDKDRLVECQLRFLMQLQSSYTYCEALLELMREAFARILNCGSNMLCGCSFLIGKSRNFADRSALLKRSVQLRVWVLLARQQVGLFTLWGMLIPDS